MDKISWELGTSSSLYGNITKDDLKECKNWGIENIELCLFGEEMGSTFNEKADWAYDVVRNIEEVGLKLWSVHLPFGPEWDISTPYNDKRGVIIEDYKKYIGLVGNLKPVCAVIHGSSEPILEDKREERLQICGQSLDILSDAAADEGLTLAVECLPRTCLGNCSSEIKTLLRFNKKLKVCCDVNHILLENHEEFIQQIGSNIVTLHISDYDGIDERHWLPGKGVIDWNSVIDNLVKTGYSGPFMYELARDSKFTPEVMAKCWESLQHDYYSR